MLVEELIARRTWLILIANVDQSGNGFKSAFIHFMAFLKIKSKNETFFKIQIFFNNCIVYHMSTTNFDINFFHYIFFSFIFSMRLKFLIEIKINKNMPIELLILPRKANLQPFIIKENFH